MIVDCAHYVDGSRQSDRTISLDEAALQIYQGGFVWLGMFEPSGEELDEVRYAFGLHELAVEDAKSFHLRPKVEGRFIRSMQFPPLEVCNAVWFPHSVGGAEAVF